MPRVVPAEPASSKIVLPDGIGSPNSSTTSNEIVTGDKITGDEAEEKLKLMMLMVKFEVLLGWSRLATAVAAHVTT